MMTTSTVSPVRTSFLLVAALAFLMTVESAGATPQKRASSDANAAGSAAICGALGGNASVVNDGFDLQIEGSKGRTKTSTTHCQGGLLGGMTCTNYDNGTSDCSMGLVGGNHQPEIEATGGVVVDGPAPEAAPIDELATPRDVEPAAGENEQGSDGVDPAIEDGIGESDDGQTSEGESPIVDPAVVDPAIVEADAAPVADATVEGAPVDTAVVEPVVAESAVVDVSTEVVFEETIEEVEG